ncbi:Serine/threonine-protein phosphatase 7 long form [Sesamum angolense]|uniref:Serine/threonine-protein phosphatase 7 long form n=1 Tax=Sesamum angolense TaxID=2727404 RepID=A0AAE1WBQ7_9LAMI|nr:Serine/threonine-protein phosphatase 7 long form [Sesamum angolense]
MDRRAVYGPRNGTVLSQQSQHRSDDILDGDSDEVLQAKRADGKFWKKLREQDLPIRVQQILHQIGFYGVYRCGRIQYDCHLITALVEKWRSETHSFHFRVGEATITLQDVSPDTPNLIVVQYARAVALLLLGGTMCPDSSGNLISLLYLAKLEDITAARNYSWGSVVLAFLYCELCNASEKGKAAVGGALQLVQIWAWSRIIPLCPGLGAPRIHMGQHSIDNNRVLPAAPYGAMWNCEHTFTRTVRTTVRVIRDILDEMQYDQIGFCSTYSTSLDGKDDMARLYKDNPFPTEEIQIEDIENVDVEGYRQLVAQFEHEVQIIKEAITHQPQQIATPSDTAPTTSHRQRRSYRQMSIGSVERGDIGVDRAGPSTTYTPQDYYVPQPPQDYYVPQPSQDDWFQSTSYMPSHAEAYSSHVDLDLGLGINQPYAPGYNISPVSFPSFSAYRDNVESSSAASSSGLHINSGGDGNDVQNEPIQNMGEEIRRPRRQRHRRNCGTGGHF